MFGSAFSSFSFLSSAVPSLLPLSFPFLPPPFPFFSCWLFLLPLNWPLLDEEVVIEVDIEVEPPPPLPPTWCWPSFVGQFFLACVVELHSQHLVDLSSRESKSCRNLHARPRRQPSVEPHHLQTDIFPGEVCCCGGPLPLGSTCICLTAGFSSALAVTMSSASASKTSYSLFTTTSLGFTSTSYWSLNVLTLKLACWDLLSNSSIVLSSALIIRVESGRDAPNSLALLWCLFHNLNDSTASFALVAGVVAVKDFKISDLSLSPPGW